MAPKKKQRRRRRRRVGLPRANRAADLSQLMGIPPTVRTVQGKTFREMSVAEKETLMTDRNPLTRSQTNELLALGDVPKSKLSRRESRRLDDFAARVHNAALADPSVLDDQLSAAQVRQAARRRQDQFIDDDTTISPIGSGASIGGASADKTPGPSSGRRDAARAALVGGAAGGGSFMRDRTRREREPWATVHTSSLGSAGSYRERSQRAAREGSIQSFREGRALGDMSELGGFFAP